MGRTPVAVELRRVMEALLTAHVRGTTPTATLAAEFGFSAKRLETHLRGLVDVDMPQVDGTFFEVFGLDEGEVEVADRHELFRSAPRLTVDHALALLTGLSAVADLGDPELTFAAERLARKLRDGVVRTAGPDARRMLDALTPAGTGSAEGQVVRVLRRAAGHVRVTVTLAGGETVTLDPIAVVAYDGRVYLHAYDREGATALAVPMHRIVSAVTTAEPVALPAGLPPFDRSAGASRPVGLELAVTAEAAWIAEYYDCSVLALGEDGSLLVEMYVPDRDWAVRFLRRMGGAVRLKAIPGLPTYEVSPTGGAALTAEPDHRQKNRSKSNWSEQA